MKTKMGIVLIFIPFLLNGCLTHWMMDTQTRLQVENHTSARIANLRIVALDGSAPDISWMPDTIETNKRSRVFTEDLVGTFHFRISSEDSTCGDSMCWRDQELGDLAVDGGSALWRMETSGSKIIVDVR